MRTFSKFTFSILDMFGTKVDVDIEIFFKKKILSFELRNFLFVDLFL